MATRKISTSTPAPFSAWRTGADLALALLEDADTVGQAASLEAKYRAAGKPQENFVLGYLDQVARLGDRKITEAFAAVLSEYISDCAGGGVPYLHVMREIAASPPSPGTGEMADDAANEKTSRDFTGGLGETDTAEARSGRERRSSLTRGEVLRTYALVSAARAQLEECRRSDPDAAARAGSEIAIELLNLAEDVLMENEGGTEAGAGFKRGAGGAA